MSNEIYTAPLTPREDILMAAQGLVAQNFDRQTAQAAAASTSQTIYVSLIPCRAGTVITNLHIGVATTAGIGTATSFMGLYSRAFVRLAVTADLGTAFNSTGNKTAALTSPYTATTSDGIFGAVVGTNSTQSPSFARGSTSANLAAALGSGSVPFGTGGTGQTSLPTGPITIVATNGIAYWMGAS